MSYFPSISQNVTVDTVNSVSDASIVTYVNPSDIWNYNGTGCSTLGVNAIQLVVTSTQNLTIYVDQGNANNAFQITDTYDYLTTKQFGLTVQAVGAYVRVRAKNLSGITATITIDTVLCPIVEAVPRSLDSFGNLKVALQSSTDRYGFNIENTPQGDTRSISPVKLVGTTFEGSIIDPTFWNTILQNGGTITQVNGRLDMLTNSSTNGSALIFSNRKGRYVIGSANLCRIQGRVGDIGTMNNIRQWGAGLGSTHTLTISSAAVVAGDVYTDISGVQYTILISGTVTTAYVFATGTPTAGARTYTKVSGTGAATLTGSAFAINATLTDGYCFQLDSSTFSVVTLIGGTPTLVNSGSFNGNKGTTYYITSNLTTWEIYYNTKTVWFVIDGEILHSVSNLLTPLSNTQTLHVFLKNTNSNNSTSNVGLYTRSASIRRLGLLNTENTSKYITTATSTICKYGPGRLKFVVVGDTNLNAGDFTLYDGLSAAAPIIGVIAIPKQAAATPFTIIFDTPFHNGLTVVNAVACKCTVIYE
jgi:hypothetical protein